jgi:hypothetical protein
MLHIIFGDDRSKSNLDAKRILGSNYENIDAEDLEISDFPTVFLGTSLFEDSRKILIRGLADHKELFDELIKYVETPHEIVVLETKINGSWTSFKELKKKQTVEIIENKIEEKVDRFLSFNIYETAMKNPQQALKMLKKAEETEDPYAMLGAWASKAVKNLSLAPTSKRNKMILKELARIDNLLKTTKFSENPWTLLETFILLLQNS